MILQISNTFPNSLTAQSQFRRRMALVVLDFPFLVACIDLILARVAKYSTNQSLHHYATLLNQTQRSVAMYHCLCVACFLFDSQVCNQSFPRESHTICVYFGVIFETRTFIVSFIQSFKYQFSKIVPGFSLKVIN